MRVCLVGVGCVGKTTIGAILARRPEFLHVVEAFDAASRSGEFYEGFAVNSKNFMDTSPGTERWIAECEQLLERAVRQAAEHPAVEVAQAFELIFGLLDRIDEGRDDILFFADQGGSWQVGVDWQEVLPAHARCLALTAAPAPFARSLLGLVERHAAYDAKKLLPAIRKVASKEQAAELDLLAKASRRLR